MHFQSILFIFYSCNELKSITNFLICNKSKYLSISKHTTLYKYKFKRKYEKLGSFSIIIFLNNNMTENTRYPRSSICYNFTTLAACGPLAPSVISNSTFCPSSRVLKPSVWMAVKCTNTSSPPSLSINPNPFSALNHFTLPVIVLPPKNIIIVNLKLWN